MRTGALSSFAQRLRPELPVIIAAAAAAAAAAGAAAGAGRSSSRKKKKIREGIRENRTMLSSHHSN